MIEAVKFLEIKSRGCFFQKHFSAAVQIFCL